MELLLALGVLGFGAIFFLYSNGARERRAREKSEAILRAIDEAVVHELSDPIDFGSRLGSLICDETGHSPSSPIVLTLSAVAAQLFADEGFTRDSLPPPPHRHDSFAGEKYRADLEAQLRKLTDNSALHLFAGSVHAALEPVALAAPAAYEGGLGVEAMKVVHSRRD